MAIFEGEAWLDKNWKNFGNPPKKRNYLADPLDGWVNEDFLFFYSIGLGSLESRFIRIFHPMFSSFSSVFHQVFSLAYARFRIFEKAEPAAREIEIGTLPWSRSGQRPWPCIAARDVEMHPKNGWRTYLLWGCMKEHAFGIGYPKSRNKNNQALDG